MNTYVEVVVFDSSFKVSWRHTAGDGSESAIVTPFPRSEFVHPESGRDHNIKKLFYAGYSDDAQRIAIDLISKAQSAAVVSSTPIGDLVVNFQVSSVEAVARIVKLIGPQELFDTFADLVRCR